MAEIDSSSLPTQVGQSRRADEKTFLLLSCFAVIGAVVKNCVPTLCEIFMESHAYTNREEQEDMHLNESTGVGNEGEQEAW